MVKLQAFLRHSLRYRLVEPIRFGAVMARAALGRGPLPARVLLLGDQASYTSEQQYAPLLARREEFLRRLGVAFHRQILSDALSLPGRLLRGYDVVAFKLGFRTPAAEAQRVAATLRAALAPGARLLYFDGDDDLCVQWPEVLPLVDAYVKKHCFRDRSEYLKHRIGKTNLTDYAARTLGVDFSRDMIPRSGPVDAQQLHKIVAGWNIGLDDQIRTLYAARRELAPFANKDIDVVCRATVNAKSWIYPLRAPIIPKIASLAPRHRVLTPEQRVPQDVYYQEMVRSRICVSPFGYGEICWRDFEAVLCGCVLVKPDMSHVETEPDIFVAGKTYVQVRWDYADLVPTLESLLADPARCERIREEAFRALSSYLDGDALLRGFERVLRQAAALATPAVAAP